jgi:CSLREA domain-containing protein
MRSSRASSRNRSRLPLSIETLEDRLAPATFTVNTAVDEAVPGDGQVSLREAILKANALAGADRIEFAIGTGLQSIDLLSALPAITNPVTIAGQTQPGFAGSPLIELNGAGAGADASGIFVRAGGVGSVIRSLVINRFDDAGIRLLRTSVTVRGCFIGTDATGTIAQGNGTGIDIGGNHFVTGAGSVIGSATPGWRNVISGNLGHGVDIGGGETTGAVIQGNFIGTDATGSADLGNGGNGVNIWGPSGNLIGGTIAGAGNVISGNAGSGVLVEGMFSPGVVRLTTNNSIQGNLIGTNADGSAALGNGGHGVAVLDLTGGNLIGGAAAGAGNVISGNLGDGVRLFGADNIGNKVKGNLIGVDATGTFALGNADDGVTVEGDVFNTDAMSNVIGGPVVGARNLISGNGGDGIVLIAAIGNTILGNYIGTNVAGTGLLGNSGNGVSVDDSSTNNLIGGNTAAARNVISGNKNGIVIGAGSSDNRVQGNRIGTDRTGTVDLGNANAGVVIEGVATGNIVGGKTAAVRNLISGNDGHGVLLEGADTASNRVRGNFIGTDRTGTLDLGNTLFGVAIRGAAHDNTIGGDVAGAGNVISGNDAGGILLEEAGTTGNSVQGNWIGTDAATTLNLGNAFHGVFITDNASGNFIGGTGAGAGNIIAFNGENGVLVGSDPGQGFANPAGTGNAINRNSIFDNGALGIDLGANDGVTANDTDDPDPGPNLLQNFPVLTSAELTPTGLRVQGSLNTETDLVLRVEFFASPAPGVGELAEGKRYLGFMHVNTSSINTFNFNVVLASAGVAAGDVVTATATDLTTGNTSEFSAALTVS